MTPPNGTSALVAAVRDADARDCLFEPGGTVVVGVSGGADSVALLDALRCYAAERALRLHVAHLDHMLRSGSSDDAAFVADLARRWDLPATLRARDVRALARSTGRGLEDAARAARYAFLGVVAAQTGACAVAVAHTADDQAETVLMNFLRGAGLTGLRGMARCAPFPLPGNAIVSLADAGPAPAPHAAWPPPLARPLLAVWRTEIVAALRARDLTWRADDSNVDRRFLRNRLRHDVFPHLEAINPGVRAAVVRGAAGMADDLALVEALVDAAWTRVVRSAPGGLSFDLGAWQAEPAAVQRRLLRRAAACLVEGPTDLGWDHVTAGLRLAADGRDGAVIHLPGGLRLARDGASLTLRRVAPDLPPSRLSDAVAPLSVPGETALPGGWVVHASLRAPGAADLAPHRDPWTALLDADSIGTDLGARSRRPGDRLQPAGMGGRHKTLQDLFVDARVPRDERDGWPVIVRGDLVVWVPGVRVDRRFAVGAGSRQVLVLLLSARPPGRVAARG
jgi:tRNA(Ile)-lysidine synthetase-like protein